jgi:hypothetical protein
MTVRPENESRSGDRGHKLRIKILKTIVFPVVLYGRETWSDSKEGTWIVFESRIIMNVR